MKMNNRQHCLPIQVIPLRSKENPFEQPQSKVPFMLMQVGEQPGTAHVQVLLSDAHSSSSVQYKRCLLIVVLHFANIMSVI